jgi:hypothetical protein
LSFQATKRLSDRRELRWTLHDVEWTDNPLSFIMIIATCYANVTTISLMLAIFQEIGRSNTDYINLIRKKKWHVIRTISESKKHIPVKGFVAVLRPKNKRYFNL